MSSQQPPPRVATRIPPAPPGTAPAPAAAAAAAPQRPTGPAAPPGAAGESVLDMVDMFRPLPDAVKRQLETHLVRRTLKTGEVLFNQGDPGEGMFFVLQGAVAVFLTDNNLGLSVELARLGAGNTIGEMALVTGQPRSASVRAAEETLLAGLSREIFYHLVQAAPQVGLIVAGVMARRLDAVNKAQGIEFGTLKGRSVDPVLLDAVPMPLIKRHRMVPLEQRAGVVLVATPDPANRTGLDDIRRMLGDMKVELMAVSEADFNTFISTHPGGGAGAAVRPGARTFNAPLKPVTFLSDAHDDAKQVSATAASQDVTNLSSSIIAEALERGASDIHMEAERRQVVVRYRVDGRTVQRDGSIPYSLHAPLISRLKVLAGMDITERRLPQDGRMSLEYQGKPYDLRCATVNAKHGEKLVMRVLDASKMNQDLGALIVSDKVASVVRKLFYRPNGLLLVTGPTGSGKTTTLYAALRERMTKENVICTVEDPIEYDLPGVTQVQVNENINLGFAEVMRTFMRQDPDIILLGETRDATTAKLACNAALTGHLVLSSFHTNDVMGAVMRMRSMGVEPYLISSALLGVINQRLVRRICPNCRVEQAPGEMVLKNLHNSGVVLDANAKFYKGTGCDRCNKEGFKGRVGVYELLLISQRVRDVISQENCTVADIRAAAMDGSYVPMSRFAAHLLTQGYTVPSEVIRILPKEEKT